MKCIPNITRSDVKRRGFTLIRIPKKKSSKREKAPPVAMENLGFALKCWFDHLASKMRRRDKFFL